MDGMSPAVQWIMLGLMVSVMVYATHKTLQVVETKTGFAIPGMT